MDYKNVLISFTNCLVCLLVASTSFSQQSTSQMARDQEIERQRRQLQMEANKRNQQGQSKSSSSGNTTKKVPLASEAMTTIEDKTPDQNRLRKIKSISVSNLGYKTDLWGLIDQNGTEIVPPKYLNISFASINSYAVFGRKDESDRFSAWGFIDSDGKVIVPLVYDKVLSGFNEGTAMVVLNNKKFLINESGKVVGSKTDYITAAEIADNEVARIAIRNADDEKNYSLGKQNQALGKLKVALGFYNHIFNYTDNYLGNWLERKQMRVDLLLRKAICILNDGISANGRIADAMHYLMEYKKAGGTDPKQYLYTGLAIKFYSSEFYDYPEFVQFKDALPYFKEYETKETIALQEETNLFYYLAEYYRGKNDHSNALLYYQKYNTRVKGYELFHQTTLGYIIDCYLAMNDITSAAAYVHKIKYPYILFDAYKNIAIGYFNKADFANALLYADSFADYWLKINHSYPIPSDLVGLRAHLHYKLEKYDEALVGFTKLIDSRDGDAYIYYLRGNIHKRLGKDQLACSDWSEAKHNFQYKSNSASKVPLFVTKAQIDSALSTCTPKMLKPIKGYKYTKYPNAKD